MRDVGENYPFEEGVKLLDKYAWLVEFRVVDFLTSQYWEACKTIPEDWRRYVEMELDDEEYVEKLMSLADPQAEERTDDHIVYDFARDIYKYSFVLAADASYKSPQKRRNVAEKKSYEIEVLGEIIADIMSKSGLSHAVDIGVGQGYLAMELLDINPEYQVVGVESCNLQVHGALSRIQERSALESRLQIRQIHLDAGKSGSDLDLMVFNDQIPNYLMYSLHACGSLSEAMIQLFRDPHCHAKILFNVACCYNLIDTSLPGDHFPMSEAIKGIWRIPITRNLKMVACQAPYRWSHRPKQTRNFFKRHFFRALVELTVNDRHREAPGRTMLVGNIGDSKLESFSAYAMAAYANMNLDPPNTDYLIDIYEKFRHLEKAMAFLWTMRALLGPVVEAIILYDRYIYAKEHMPFATVSLEAIFDPLKSPRNMALIVKKPTNER
jgi:hypothetical protein